MGALVGVGGGGVFHRQGKGETKETEVDMHTA